MNQLINIAAWICAIATVIYQRLIIPAIHRYTPELLQLLEAPQLALAPATDPPVLVQLQQQGQPIPITRKRRRKSTTNSPA